MAKDNKAAAPAKDAKAPKKAKAPVAKPKHIAIGLHKGHVVKKRTLPALPSHRKGVRRNYEFS